MEHLDIFILFPETDDEILALGEKPDQYHAIVRELQEVINVLNGFDYRLYYDETNLKSLIAKAQEICDEKYLSDPIQQLRLLLSRRTTNIRRSEQHDIGTMIISTRIIMNITKSSIKMGLIMPKLIKTAV